jgi:hypothetical protein
MDPRATKTLLNRLAKLERESVRLRKGRVTATVPLTVDLGSSGVPHRDVPVLAGATVALNDIVAVLISGNNIVVLGKVI